MTSEWIRHQQPLPGRCDPLPDESFTSWIVRLAARHGLKLHAFGLYLWGGDARFGVETSTAIPRRK